MKKILFYFLVCASYLAPFNAFSQANKYFHDRIDTTIYATTTGTDAYTGTNTDPNFNVAGYVRGLMVSTFIVNGNTGACTYRLVTRTGALSAVAIKKQNGAALVAGDIPDSTAVLLLYYGSFWRLEGLYSTASSAWSLTGNTGTVAGANFLGTTDAVDLVFKTNNTEKARISSAGVLSLGLASTNNGSLLFSNSTNANTLTINSGVTSASYALTLPTAQGAANSLLLNDGAGALSWNTGGGLFWALDGNTVGAEKWIGTADNFDLPFRTNNVENMILNTSGNLGIGIDPTARLHIKGSGATSASYWLKVDNSASSPMLYGRDDGAMAINSSTLLSTAALKIKGRFIASTQEVTNNNRVGLGAAWNAFIEVGVDNGMLFSRGTDGTVQNDCLGEITGNEGLQIIGRDQLFATKFFLSGKIADSRMVLSSNNANDLLTFTNVGVLNLTSTASQDAMNILKNNAGTTLGATWNAFQVVNADATANRLSKIGFTASVGTAQHAFLGARFLSATAGEMFFGTKTGGVEAIALTIDQNQSSLFSGRSEAKQGTDVVSSSTITITYTGSVCELTGTTAVDFITTTDWQIGSELVLIANENVTINDDAGGGNIRLAGNANFAMTADDVLTLIYSETTAGGTIWREKSRSVN